MRKTYAYNSIIIGVLVGMLVGVSSDSVVLAVLAGLGVAVVGFIVIRLIENAINAGADKLADKATDAYRRHKEQKAMQNGSFVQQNTTQMPGAAQAQQRTVFPQQTAAAAETASEQMSVCPSCGAQVRAAARFCPSCGCLSLLRSADPRFGELLPVLRKRHEAVGFGPGRTELCGGESSLRPSLSASALQSV